MATTNTPSTGGVENAAALTDTNNAPDRVAKYFSFELYDSLVEICQNTIRYFESDTKITTNQRFLDAFRKILQQVEIIRQYITEFNGFAHEYDFDEQTPGNGYRSIVKITHEYIKHTVKVGKYIAENRSNLLFRKKTYVKEIESCSLALVGLCGIFDEAKKVKEKCEPASLIPSGECKVIGLFNLSAAVEQSAFYGRCVGLHYCSSMQSTAKLLGVVMAGFSDMFYSKRSNPIPETAKSIATLSYKGSKYHHDPELRAKRILELSLYSSVDFNQAYLSLTESKAMHGPVNMFNTKIKVNRMLTIPPEPLEIECVNEPNKMIEIPVPTSHLGVQPIKARLLSNVRRQGMQFDKNERNIHPKSNSLVIHCHGGGFIAHTSKSHEIYLRGWAAKLQVPILSIDYSLAPQAPYPRALEEIFYAYCWAIKNAEQLGTTAEKIIVVGDSAGATLNMALSLKCIEQSVRKPDGIFLIYAPLIINFEPSPSRILCTIDVMLPMGFQMGYIKAYLNPDKITGASTTDSATNDVTSDASTTPQPIENDDSSSSVEIPIKRRFSTSRNPADDYLFDIPRDPFISPLYAEDEMLEKMPPVKLLTLENDPFFDESITMAKRLKALGKSVGLDILPGLSHGFLHFIKNSKDASAGNRLCIARLAELLGNTEVTLSDNDETSENA